MKEYLNPDFKDVKIEETLKASFESTEMALNILMVPIKNTESGLDEKEIDLELSRIIRMLREEEDGFAYDSAIRPYLRSCQYG